MKTYHQFYINGEWVDPEEGVNSFDVINPSNEEVIGQIALGSAKDVDKAVSAAQEAFTSFSQTTVEERLGLLGKIVEIYQSRYDEIATRLCGRFQENFKRFEPYVGDAVLAAAIQTAA